MLSYVILFVMPAVNCLYFVFQKGLIGMDPPPERYLEPIERFWGFKKKMKPKVSWLYICVCLCTGTQIHLCMCSSVFVSSL